MVCPQFLPHDAQAPRRGRNRSRSRDVLVRFIRQRRRNVRIRARESSTSIDRSSTSRRWPRRSCIATPDLDVCRGDSIRTGERSRATIVFIDSTRLVIDQNTEWVVREPTEPGRTLIESRQRAPFSSSPASRARSTSGRRLSMRWSKVRSFWCASRPIAPSSRFSRAQVTAANANGSLILASNESAVACRGRRRSGRSSSVRGTPCSGRSTISRFCRRVARGLEQIRRSPARCPLLRTEGADSCWRGAAGRGTQ